MGTGGIQAGVHLEGTGSQVTSGGGNVLVTGLGGGSEGSASDQGVNVQESGQITAGGIGTVTVQGNGGAASGDSQHGVRVSCAGSQITSSSGNVQITGHGGGSGTSGNNHGVSIQTDGLVTAGGTGTVTVQGTGGTGTGDANGGVIVFDGSAKITSSGGNVQITGQGGGSGTSRGNDGVHVQDPAVQVTAGGSGTVTLRGTGGSGNLTHGVVVQGAIVTSSGGNVQLTGHGGGSATTSNDGVRVSTAGQVTAGGNGTVILYGTGGSGSGGSSNGVVVHVSATVTSGGGDVQITGLGGGGSGSSNDNKGVLVTLSGQISAGGTGKITLQGTGGSETGDGNDGIRIGSSAIISTNGGNIQATGIEGAGTSCLAISVTEESTIFASASNSTVTLIGNSMSLAGASAIIAGSSVTLRSFTSGVGIDLGLATDSIGGPLGLTDAEFNVIIAGTINIGDPNSGPITISADITRQATANIDLTAGAEIHFTTGSLNTAGGNLALNPTSSVGVVNPNTEITVDTGTLSFTSPTNLPILINGTATAQPGGYDQLTVSGNVNLAGLNLQLAGTYTPAVGDQFTIVNNSLATGLTIGEFNGLPQDEIFTVTNGSFAASFQITYHGGDGNDAVITAINIAPSFDHLTGDYTAADENPATHGPALEQIVSGWATNITVGPAHESMQQPTFMVHTDNPGLFAVQPAVDPETGALTYTPAPNKHGTAHVTVVLQDNGGGTNASPETSSNIVIVKTHRLHNAAESGERNGLDVTGSTSSAPDGFIVSADVLAVINYINANGSGSILDSNTSVPPYPDVDADDQVVAQDVLKIINYINAHPEQTEGEATEPSQIEANNLITLLALDIAEQAPRRRRLQ